MPFIKNVAIFAKKTGPSAPAPPETGSLMAGIQNTMLVLKPTGSLWGWGSFGGAQIGNTTYNFTTVSTPVGPTGGATKTFCKIGICATNGYGIDKNGQLWSWGYNYYGSIGIGTVGGFELVQTPRKIDSTKTFCHIEGGNHSAYHGMALDKNGKAWGWGYNYNGQLGVNTNLDSYSVPTAVAGPSRTFCQIATSAYHTCAIDKNGKAWCWGVNYYGNLGVSTATQSALAPIAVGGAAKTFCEIQVSTYHSVAIDKNGKVWSWGYGGNGLIGDNSYNQTITPKALYGSKTFCKISTLFDTMLAIDKDGKAWGWGKNDLGQLGVNTSDTFVITPKSIYGTRTFCQIEASYDFSTAIDKNNNFWSWGNDDVGQLGIGGNYNKNTPVSLQATNKTFCKVHNGYGQHAFVIGTNSVIWGWGDASGYPYRTSPVSVSNPNNLIMFQIAMPIGGMLGIDSTGKAWGWGGGGYGSTGNNSYANYPASTVVGARTFCKISAGQYHSVALDYNGKAWSWGANYINQLGQNIPADYAARSSPAAVCGGAKTFCEISCGGLHTLVTDKYGKIWSWGSNYYGELGDNSATAKNTPVSIVETNTKTFCKISGGNSHSLGLDKNGRLWAWGVNFYGQVGDNSTFSRKTPVCVCGAVKTFCKISAGNNTSYAIDQYGKLWAWGVNNYGQLGDATLSQRVTPVSVYGTKTFCEVRSLDNAAFGIDKNGKIWAWGFWKFVGGNPIFRTPIQLSAF